MYANNSATKPPHIIYTQNVHFHLACLFIRNTQEENKTICLAKIVFVWIMYNVVFAICTASCQKTYYSLRSAKIHISVIISFSEIRKQIVYSCMPTHSNIIFVFNKYICDECSSSTNRTICMYIRVCIAFYFKCSGRHNVAFSC